MPNESNTKKPLKELPDCYGNPEPECVSTCALEPSCGNRWLFEKDARERERERDK
jgi:hypothetical protein